MKKAGKENKHFEKICKNSQMDVLPGLFMFPQLRMILQPDDKDPDNRA